MRWPELPREQNDSRKLSICASGFAAPGCAARRRANRAAQDQDAATGSERSLIVEGAGGALVPINRTQLMTDLMRI